MSPTAFRDEHPGGIFQISNHFGNPTFSNGYDPDKERENKNQTPDRGDSSAKDDRRSKASADALSGTTLKVYRFLYRKGRPMGIHDVQKGLKLSSPSVSSYHLKKLLQAGLVKESSNGYVVDKIVFENTIRLGKARIPFKSSFSIFFGLTLGILLTLLRPSEITSTYIFAVGISGVAFAYSLYETLLVMRQIY